MYKKYNPNPERLETGDCAIRALCKALNEDWDSVFAEVIVKSFFRKEMPSSNRIWGEVLHNHGYIRHMAECLPDDFTVRDFAQAYPVGIYVLGLHGHVVTLVNGDWYDLWDSGSRVVEYYWTK